MMNLLLAAIALSSVVIGGPRIEGTTDELVQRYEAECPGGIDCGLIRDELEFQLYNDLRLLYRLGEDVDQQTLYTAAAAKSPQLALLALRWMNNKPMDGDDKAVAAALESDSPAVRSAALALLGNRLPPEVKALGEWIVAESYSEDDALIPTPRPDADLLGFEPYPNARLVRLASGRGRAFYTTPDPPEKVIATIGKGKKVLDVNAFYQRISEAIVLPDMDKLMAEMEKMLAETDPEKQQAMQASIEKMMQPSQPRETDLLTVLGPVMSRGDARIIILRAVPGSTPDSPPQATRVAAVFHDDALKTTVILVPLE